jgi:hypothetical protein
MYVVRSPWRLEAMHPVHSSFTDLQEGTHPEIDTIGRRTRAS